MILYPLIYILSASFSSGNAVISNKVWLWPVEFNLRGYEAVFKHKLLLSGYMNSLFYMVAGTTLNVFMTIIAAYPLSRNDLYGKRIFMVFFVFTMMFNGGMIPTYMLVRDLGMINTRWAMIIPGTTGALYSGAMGVYYVIITRTYFQHNIPLEMLEASRLDGCSDFRFLRSIVIPLSGPIIAVITLYYAVINHWNSFTNGLLYLSDPKLFPLQLVLRDILVNNQIEMSMFDVEGMMKREELSQLLKYSTIVVASVPVMIIYPLVQRHFVKGIMIGSIKG